MLKISHLSAVISAASILWIAETAFSLPSTAIAQYPIEPSSHTDQLVCYMQTADGTTLNLNSLCGKKPSLQSQIVVSDVFHEDDYIIGRVINKSNQTLYQARVNYEALSKNGSVIERGAIAIEPPTLNPGQTGMFETFMPSDIQIRTTSVEGNEKE